MKTEKRLDLGELATFVPNKGLPVYNWFYFKEGFSRDLVMLLLDRYAFKGNRKGSSGINNGKNQSLAVSGSSGINNGKNQSLAVLDPFVGSGTTLVACRERGIDSYGFDVSPLAVLSGRAKTNDYDLGVLKEAIKELSKTRFQRQDLGALPGNIRRFFNPHTLEDVLFFREQIEKYKGETGDFLKLGLITSTTRCSYMYKDGAVLKVRRKPVPVFRKFLIRTLRKMLWDLQKVEFKPSQAFVGEGDARDLKLDSGFIDLVITSPPYLNKIEYTRIYGVEEFLFFGGEGRPGIRSYIGLDTEAEPVFPDLMLPAVANAYFKDMKMVLKELYRVCKPGAILAFVIGDGCFPEGVVHCDTLLPKLAEGQGFGTERVYILNERWCTRERTIKVGKMEESLIILKKG